MSVAGVLMESVLDDHGRHLVDAWVVSAGTHQRAWEIEPVSGAPLFDYYFGRGRHVISLDACEPAIRGTLRTSWRDGRRVWYVDVNADLTQIATASPQNHGMTRDTSPRPGASVPSCAQVATRPDAVGLDRAAGG